MADSLPFEAGEFDAAVSRLGAMFFPDPIAAIQEMLRVVKPGGRIALAVWGDSNKNPFFTLVTEALSHYMALPPEEPDAPGAFRFSEGGKLRAIVEQAGAANAREQVVSFRIEAPISPEEFWRARIDLSDSLRDKISRLSQDQFKQLSDEVIEAAGRFYSVGAMSLPAEVILVSAEKPAEKPAALA
jgi:SAM-dependent methyltransferase